MSGFPVRLLAGTAIMFHDLRKSLMFFAIDGIWFQNVLRELAEIPRILKP